MKIEHLLGDLSEARRGNFGREVSRDIGRLAGQLNDKTARDYAIAQGQQAAANAKVAEPAPLTLQQRLDARRAAQAAGAATGPRAPVTPAPLPGSTAQPAPSPAGRPAPSPAGSPAPSPSGSPAPSPAGSPAPSPSGSPAPSPSGSPAPSPAEPGPDRIGQLAGIAGKARDLAGGLARGVGNVASEIGQAATAPIGATVGGLFRGYQTARQGGQFTSPTQSSSSPGYVGGAGSNAPGAINGAAGSPMSNRAIQQLMTQNTTQQDEISDLKSRLDAIDQRLTRARIAERQS